MNKVLGLLFITLTFSCSENTRDEQFTVLHLSPTEGKMIDCERQFEPMEIIPLKEKENFHIRAIKKIELFNGEYYVLCNNSKNVIAVFNHAGDKIREIGRWGKGHGEHGQILDFCIDRENLRVIILESSSHVTVYSLTGGYISDKIISKSALWNIESIDGNVLCTTNHQTYTEGNEAFLFYIYDADFNLLTKHTKVLPEYMGMFSLITMPLKTFNNQFVYSDFYSHNMYILDKTGKIIRTYRYGKKNLMPAEYFRDMTIFQKHQMKYDFVLDNAVLNDTIISIYKENNQVRIALNRSNGELLKDCPISVPVPKIYAMDGNTLLSVGSIEDLYEMEHKDIEDNLDYSFFIIRFKINSL